MSDRNRCRMPATTASGDSARSGVGACTGCGAGRAAFRDRFDNGRETDTRRDCDSSAWLSDDMPHTREYTSDPMPFFRRRGVRCGQLRWCGTRSGRCDTPRMAACEQTPGREDRERGQGRYSSSLAGKRRRRKRKTRCPRRDCRGPVGLCSPSSTTRRTLSVFDPRPTAQTHDDNSRTPHERAMQPRILCSIDTGRCIVKRDFGSETGTVSRDPHRRGSIIYSHLLLMLALQ
jgi:hypothetical protein